MEQAADPIAFGLSKDIAMLLLFLVVMPLTCMAVIFLGERWRSAALAGRTEVADFDQDLDGVYRESQNPAWCYLLVLAIIVFGLLPFVFWVEPPDNPMILWPMFVVMLPLFLLFGLFFEVNDREIVVRFGLLRIPIKRIALDSIVSIEEIGFRPIMDFGGWGIRTGMNGTWAYFMSGNRGVLLTVRTPKGKEKKYLIGSDTPPRLAEAIRKRSGIEHRSVY